VVRRAGKPPSNDAAISNQAIASMLLEVAGLLETQSANPFRIAAYRHAAAIVSGLPQPAGMIFGEEGLEGFTRLRGIGESLSASIEEIVRTGRLALLERLRGEVQRDDSLLTMPGIGPQLAQRIREQIRVESLEDLETAAYDGRLRRIPGMGAKRVRAIRDTLAGRFGRRPTVRRLPENEPQEVSVAELLDIDREYRDRVRKQGLPSIAPRRYNPTGAAWLPVLHTQRGERHYTALYSNSLAAHKVGTIHDWVVIYRDDKGGSGVWTAITSRYGTLRGKRVIRGREAECARYYDQFAEQRQLRLLEPAN